MKTVAILFARKNSKSIPGKNKRYIGGRPLIVYPLKALQKSKNVDSIYVFSDDKEILSIAAEHGIRSFERNPDYAIDDATLDEAIYDLLKKGFLNLDPNDTILSVQPTSIFLNTETIDKVIKEFSHNDVDTVLTIKEERKLKWKKINSKLIPLYSQRINRQQIEPEFTETGAIVACKLDLILKSKSRFGEKVIGVMQTEKQALDIDNYYDWWLAETLIKRKKILIDVIGSKFNGFGHVGRQLVIYEKLHNHDVTFICDETQDLAIKVIREKNIPLKLFKNKMQYHELLNNCDVLIRDRLDSKKKEIKELKKIVKKIVCFEDLSEEALKNASICINSMIPSIKSSHSNSKTLFGLKYCILRDEFISWSEKSKNRNRERINKIDNILIMFGGTDAKNMTEKILSWILKIEEENKFIFKKISVIIGPGKNFNGKLLKKNLDNKRIQVFHNIGNVAEIMHKSDLAISTSGRTIFELTAMSVLTISLAAGERESMHDYATKGFGVIHLGSSDDLLYEKFKNRLTEVINSKILREKLIQYMENMNIDQGTNRVKKALLTLIEE